MEDNIVRVFVIGDLHFKISNVKDTELMVEAILNELKRHPINIIVILGDIIDEHDRAHQSPYDRAIKFLSQCMFIATTYILIGNHDLINNNQFLSDAHFFNPLKYWGKNMVVVDTTTAVIIKNMLFTFVPYVPKGRFVEALTIKNPTLLSPEINNIDLCTSSTCIFAHQEFFGAKMGSHTSETGDLWPKTNSFVCSGHYHDYYELGTNILYIGAPIQHAFGESKKTVSYFEFTPTDRKQQRIDLGLKQKQIVRINCEEVNSYVPIDNCDLKIIISGTSASNSAIKSHPKIISWKQLGHKISYKNIPDKVIISQSSPKIQKFSTTLRERISDNSDLVSLYTELFGNNENVVTTLNIL